MIAPNAFGLGIRDVAMPVVPMFHANAWGIAQAAPAAGSALVFPGAMMQPKALAEPDRRGGRHLHRRRPDHLAGRAARTSPAARTSCATSAAAARRCPRRCREAYREQVGLPILQAWGMTETRPVASSGVLPPQYDDADDETKAAQRARAGIPLFGVEARIVDADTLEAQPWDDTATGELQVRGPWCAKDYYNPDAGVELSTEDGWMKTGDVAAMDAYGSIRIADRTKDLIKSGGEWISSVDLENAIMSHPAVKEAAVIGIPHPKWDERPLACVVLKEGETATEEEILEHLKPLVAKWWLPDAVEFIDEVPKTSVGKFSKKDLRSTFAEYPAKASGHGPGDAGTGPDFAAGVRTLGLVSARRGARRSRSPSGWPAASHSPHAAADVDRVEAVLVQPGGHPRRPAAAAAGHVDRVALGEVVEPGRDVAHRDVGRAVDVPVHPFVVLTDVEDDGVVGQLVGGDGRNLLRHHALHRDMRSGTRLRGWWR